MNDQVKRTTRTGRAASPKAAAPKTATPKATAQKRVRKPAVETLAAVAVEAAPEPTSAAAETQLQVLRAETAYLRQRLAETEEQLARLKGTIAYRLGTTLMSLRSFEAAAKLPRQLMDLRSDSKAKRKATAQAPAVAKTSGVAGKRAEGLTAKAKALRDTDLAEAIRLGREAVELEPKGYRIKWLASLMYDAGMVDEPTALLERAWEIGEPFTPDQNARLEVLRGLARIRANGLPLPARGAAPAWEPAPRSVAYVAASSLPHHVSGYTTRTHNLVRAIGAQGWDVAAFTRPGYPWDRPDAVKVDPGQLSYPVDEVTYERLEGSGANRTAFDQYVSTAAASLGAAFASRRPAVVHAASNYVNALPALVAARQAGVPFVYEVRGLWEFTAAQRSAAGEAGERFEVMRDLEILVAREADAVLTINEALKRELISRGVEADRIGLAHNSVDIAQFQPIPRDEDLRVMLGLQDRYVLGFVGSIVDYEGLDDAVEAVSLLNRGGLNVSMLLVGGGKAEKLIREKAEALGVSDRVILAGRVAPTAVQRYYSVIDLAVFPRKPVAVNEIVSPLKPLEAMAMEKPVLASNVAALAEMVRDEETGLLFQKGDVASMATAISRIIHDRDLATRLGANARRFVETERTWDSAAAEVTRAYDALMARRG